MGIRAGTLENMGLNSAFWQGKKVLITGHTGFKGAWLALWLQQLAAEVTGIALKPASQPNLFEKADIANNMHSYTVDIRELSAVKQSFLKIQPDIVIHMAAQSLVRYSYENPVETYQSNVMGTLHVLEAMRECKSIRAAVMVTTDKCYENKEWIWPYREHEALGGHDPYSSSKACCELLIASYRNSFLSDNVAIATARAGNVIGGGDWAKDRLIPDLIKAIQNRQRIKIRNPQASRPWQFVLEPLFGYLLLAEKLFNGGQDYTSAWNFGPKIEDIQSVQWILEEMTRHWDQLDWEKDSSQQLHEANTLKLDSSKAIEKLNWKQQYSLAEAIEKTAAWYQAEQKGLDMRQFCLSQINDFSECAIDGNG